MLDLQDRSVLVVGGGGGGIGTAIVETLARAGAHIGAISVSGDDLVDTEARVTQLGRRASISMKDVTSEQELVEGITEIWNDLGSITDLVNVVGGATPEDWWPGHRYDMAAFDRVIVRNLRYAVVSCREIAGRWIEQRRAGSIVNISSVVAASAAPFLGAYGAAKAGLESFTRTLAVEWGQYGIRVNTVAPGTIKTPRTGNSDLSESALTEIPIRRRGQPTEVAYPVLFLLSDLASYITGQTLTVDGGIGLGRGPGEGVQSFITNPEVRARFA